MGIALRWGSATDVGRVRTNNEDSFLEADTLFAVADGMGGHAGGEIASSVAVQALKDHVEPGLEGQPSGLGPGRRRPRPPRHGHDDDRPRPDPE